MSSPMPTRGQEPRQYSRDEPQQKNDTDETPRSFTWQEFTNYVIQLIGIISAIVFGVWAVKSFDAAITSNRLSYDALQASQLANVLAAQALDQSIVANQLAMLDFCSSNQTFSDSTCTNFTQSISLSNISAIISLPQPNRAPSPTTSTPSSSTTSNPSHTSSPSSSPNSSTPKSKTSMSLGAIMGIVVGAVFALGAIAAFMVVFVRVKSSRAYGMSNLEGV